MPLVQCTQRDCIFCDVGNDCVCKAVTITISDEWDEGCSGFESYINQPDYNNKYYVAVKTKSGELAKARRYSGKRIEYKGRVFYTSERLEDAEYCSVTDAETGVNCGPYAKLADHFDQICEQVKKHPKIETLPEAEWICRGYEIVKEKHLES